MEKIITDYISSTFSVMDDCTISIIREYDRNTWYTDNRIYYKELSGHLHKMFRLDKYELDGYLLSWILDIDPDFYWTKYRLTTKPESIHIVPFDEFSMNNRQYYNRQYYMGVDIYNDMIDATTFAMAALRTP